MPLSIEQHDIPCHVSIIMDGNGRWARQKGLHRLQGHAEGTESVRRVIEPAIKYGVNYLSLYVFSTENWGRPEEEVSGLMDLLCRSVVNETESLVENGVKVVIIGERSGLPERVAEHLNMIETGTRNGDKLTVVLALNYGGREEITSAIKTIAKEVREGAVEPDDITAATIGKYLYTTAIPDPDLLIRTSGEQRLSNFLLWQTAYTEFYFTDTLWPDFGEKEFGEAIEEYGRRERRYGRIGDEQITTSDGKK